MITKTYYLAVLFLTFITTFGLTSYVWISGPERRLNRLYSTWTACVSLWSLTLVIHTLSRTPDWALLSSKILHVWASLIPLAYLNFVIAFVSSEKKLVPRLFIVLTCFSLLVIPTPWFADVQWRPRFGFFVTSPRELYPIHLGTFVACIVYATLEMFRALIRASGIRKQQIKYLLISAVVGYSGGVTNYLINYQYLVDFAIIYWTNH
jgi:hypothetical protein